MDGGTDVDEGAVLMAGAHEVLDPLVAAGRVRSQEEPRSRAGTKAAPAFGQALSRRAVASTGSSPPTTRSPTPSSGCWGQQVSSATVSSPARARVSRVCATVPGRQSMTVLTDPALQADAAARLAAALVSGLRPRSPRHR